MITSTQMNQSRTQKVFPRNISTTQASEIWLEASQRNEQSWRETLCIRRPVVCFSTSNSGVDAGSGHLWDPAGSSVGTLIMSVSAGRGNKHGATVALPRLHGTAGPPPCLLPWPSMFPISSTRANKLGLCPFPRSVHLFPLFRMLLSRSPEDRHSYHPCCTG